MKVGLLFATVLIAGATIASANPYAGQERRAIKALSADEVENYLAGRGAGFAKTAELNHYPGPAHTLELATALALSPAQRARTQAIFDSMQRDAKRYGAMLVEAEAELDRQFADQSVTQDSLRAALARIGQLQAELRHVHLAAHIAQRAVLTPEQIATYDRLRGYDGRAADGGHDHRH